MIFRHRGAQRILCGNSITDLGYYHYKYASGREDDWFLSGFPPKKCPYTLSDVRYFPQEI